MLFWRTCRCSQVLSPHLKAAKSTMSQIVIHLCWCVQQVMRPPADARRALVIVMELCDLGSLDDALRNQVFLLPACECAWMF